MHSPAAGDVQLRIQARILETRFAVLVMLEKKESKSKQVDDRCAVIVVDSRLWCQKEMVHILQMGTLVDH
jgi:hypothetical protein